MSGWSGIALRRLSAGGKARSSGIFSCKWEARLTPNPILKVLSELNQSDVLYLLMGGQACVLYGAAEFSRDTDIAVLSEADNLRRLAIALDRLRAEPIAVPPFEAKYLLRGHAVHFRCRQSEAAGVRVDVMSVMRGVASFAELWQRRTTLEYDAGMRIELLSLPDLVRAKKTQRDKDWPMVRRLVEAHFFGNRENPRPAKIAFWLRESRTISMLLDLVRLDRSTVTALLDERPLLSFALQGNDAGLGNALMEEEKTFAKLTARIGFRSKASWKICGAIASLARRLLITVKNLGKLS